MSSQFWCWHQSRQGDASSPIINQLDQRRERCLIIVQRAKNHLAWSEKILLYVRLCDLWVRAWFGIVDNIPLDMLLGTSFIAHLICEIFPSELQDVSLYSHPVAILSATQRDLPICKSASRVTVPLENPCNDEEANPHPTPIARQTVRKLHSENCVLVMTTAFNIRTVESRVFEETRQIKFVAYGMVDVLPLQPLYIHLTNFSANAM